MSKYFKRGIPFFLFVFFLMSSCENNDTTSTNTNNLTSTSTPASTDVAPATTNPAAAMAIRGSLNKLWIKADKFKLLSDARLFLRFEFENTGFLTLYGWSCENDSHHKCKGIYKNAPDLRLEKGGSGVGYGDVVFWENLVLSKTEVEGIKSQLVATPRTHVLFVPKNTNGRISYSIFLSDNPLSKDIPAAAPDLPTDVDANPSPPKNTSN